MSPVPASPTLSICLPTWQRAPLLEDCLAALVGAVAALSARGVAFEVVVSDNASTDATAEVVRSYADRLPIRHVVQATHCAVEQNVVSAMRLARGELTIYLADDDRLLTDGLLAAIDWLMADPARSAVYAPWDVLDEVSGVSHGLFYPQAAVEDYAPSDALRLLARMASRGAFPEIGVYRTRMLHRAVPTPRAVHWAHVWAQRLLAEGPLRLQTQPFYRCHTRTRVKRDRPQIGNEQARTHVDRYRGGLELAAVEALRGQPLPPAIRADLGRVVSWFTAQRNSVAARMARVAGDVVAATELEQAASLYLGGAGPELAAGAVQVDDATGPDLTIAVVAGDAAELAERLAALPELPSFEVVGVVSRGDAAATAVLDAHGARRVEVDPTLGAAERERAALLAATGWFTLVLGAGEQLDGERLQDALGLMAGRPACVALCTPAADQDGDPLVFDVDEPLALLARCVVWGVRPELAVYRTGALQAAVRSGALPLPRTFAAPWAWFYGMARRGEVCVEPRALRTGVAPDAEPMDRARAALEVALCRALGPGGLTALPDDAAGELLGLVDQTMRGRAASLAGEAAARGEGRVALELSARARFGLADRRAPPDLHAMVDVAAAEIVQEAAQFTAGWTGLAVCGIPDAAVRLLAARGPVEVRTPDTLAASPGLVLVRTRTDAERLRRTLPQGQVMAWDDVRGTLLRSM